MTDITAGKLVEFLDGGALKLGVVMGASKGGFQVRDQNGRQYKVAAKNVFIAHSVTLVPPYPSAEFQELDSSIAALQREIDTELLWETVRDEAGSLTAGQLSEVYFGETGPLHESAILRVLLQSSVYFKFRSGFFTPKGAEQVEQQLHAAKREQERDEFRKRTVNWLSDILDGGAESESSWSSEQQLVLKRIAGYLKDQQDEEIGNLLRQAGPDHSPKFAAFEVLSTLGRLPKEADPLLMTAGIEVNFSSVALTESARIPQYESSQRHTPFQHPVILSIDDVDTKEIDDAISIEESGDHVRIGIHIADVAYFVNKLASLDSEAYKRRSTLYLPNQSIRMLPERISCDLASLNCAALRPAVSFFVSLDQEGNLLGFKAERCEITVTDRLDYETADKILDGSVQGRMAHDLGVLDRVTRRLSEKRHEAGAITLVRPEVKIQAKNELISVSLMEPGSPSRRIISELMILANQIAAQLAIESKLPFIFRSQKPPSEEVTIPAHYDPVALNEVFARLEKSKLSVYPLPHSGLGLPAYTQVTSPLRRYLDLVLQRQLVAQLESAPAPYELQEIMEILGTLENAEGDLRGVERKANRLYLLRYLERQYQPQNMEAVVLKELPGGYLIETTDLLARGFLKTAAKHSPGDRLFAKTERIDPDKNVFVLSEGTGT